MWLARELYIRRVLWRWVILKNSNEVLLRGVWAFEGFTPLGGSEILLRKISYSRVKKTGPPPANRKYSPPFPPPSGGGDNYFSFRKSYVSGRMGPQISLPWGGVNFFLKKITMGE